MEPIVSELWVAERTWQPAGSGDAVFVEVLEGKKSRALEIIDRIRPETELPILLHMLIEEPVEDLQVWHQRGADGITMAWNPSLSAQTFDDLRAVGFLCGISIEVDLEGWRTKIDPLWPLLDMVVVRDREDGVRAHTIVKDLRAVRGTKERPLLGIKCLSEPTYRAEVDLWIHPSE